MFVVYGCKGRVLSVQLNCKLSKFAGNNRCTMEEELLREAGIKPTAARILIMRAMGAADHPLSMAEIGDALETVDKSVISRTLALFRAGGLIHVIQDGSESVRYELCRCSHAGDDEDLHTHFHCECCGRTFCLKDVPVHVPPLPEGFRAHSVNYVISGICPECLR